MMGGCIMTDKQYMLFMIWLIGGIVAFLYRLGWIIYDYRTGREQTLFNIIFWLIGSFALSWLEAINQFITDTSYIKIMKRK